MTDADDPQLPHPSAPAERETQTGHLANIDVRGREMTPTIETQLENITLGLTAYLESRGLPSESILVAFDERATVLANLERVLRRVPVARLGDSAYISKFVAAVVSGLFDAALNYLWNETVNELRRRVAGFDLAYFYDNAVATEKRKGLRDAEDLVRVEDSELIQGAHKIGLLSLIGFKQLDHIRYMRNWASAAHPNQVELTGLQLIAWLETCVREVVLLPVDTTTAQIGRLLANVRTTKIDDVEATDISAFFLNLNEEQVANLASGFFGLYTRPETSEETRENINRLLPSLWERVDESSRQDFGTRYGRFVASGEQVEKRLARQFLEVVDATSYFPEDLRANEISTAIDNLLAAHRNFNNFYSEPAFARELARQVGVHTAIPGRIVRAYVLAVVEVFLTNGNGVAWNADPTYRRLIAGFNANEAQIALGSFTNTTIASRLQFDLPRRQFGELLKLLRPKITSPAVLELLDDVQNFPGPLDALYEDSRIRRRVAQVRTLLRVT